MTIKVTLGLVFTLFLLGIGLPRAVGASWSEIGAALAAIPVWQLAALAALWFLGRAVHTIMMSAAMPGLSHRRSLLVSVTGSSISNVLPCGGAAGTALNYAMVRRWGFSAAEFGRFAVITNLWDTLAKLALPALAVAWLGATASGGGPLLWFAGASLILLIVVVTATCFLLHSDVLAHRAGSAVGGLAVRLGRKSVEPAAWGRRAGQMRFDTASLVSTAWLRMTIGKLAHVAVQVMLLWLSLSAVGVSVDPAVVLAAYAVQQLLSLASITPGAAGVVEVGMAGVLVALGVPPAGAAAGILTYRGFTFLLDIPVGGACTAWWFLRGRAGRKRATYDVLTRAGTPTPELALAPATR